MSQPQTPIPGSWQACSPLSPDRHGRGSSNLEAITGLSNAIQGLAGSSLLGGQLVNTVVGGELKLK